MAADTAEEGRLAKRIGSRIRARRRALGMSQETLAERLELHSTTVVNYENGKHRLSAARLARIATILNEPLNYFIADGEQDAG